GVGEHRDFLYRAGRDVGEHRLTSPALVVAGAVEHERRRPAAARGGDEVRCVDEQIAGALALTEGGVEQRQRGQLAPEDGRLVDALAVEALADLRIRAHAL